MRGDRVNADQIARRILDEDDAEIDLTEMVVLADAYIRAMSRATQMSQEREQELAEQKEEMRWGDTAEAALRMIASMTVATSEAYAIQLVARAALVPARPRSCWTE